MRNFAHLLDRLLLTPSRNAKLQLIQNYFSKTADPDRGYALAALAGSLKIASVKPAVLRDMMVQQMDETLFKLSYDYVGDLAETIALAWDNQQQSLPSDVSQCEDLSLSEIVTGLQRMGKTDAVRQLSEWMNMLDSSGRYALLKLVTGGLRIGVSARLTKQALAQMGQVDVTEIEELWHGLQPPYQELFGWLLLDQGKPVQLAAAPFRPAMLAHALVEADKGKLDPADFSAEWKWDGIRIQVSCEEGTKRIYSRSGDEISKAFPDLLEAVDFEGTIDGELLIGQQNTDGVMEIGSFGDLQQRLNRKTVSKKLLSSHPVFMRTYDLLSDGNRNIRDLPFSERRKRLEKFVPYLEPTRFDISPLVEFETWDALEEHRDSLPHPAIEGVMIKQWNSPYLAGRPRGLWFKWKRDPMIIDAVLMYAQRGHGKRSSFYSDYTFGVWTSDNVLVPVGKAYFGFTDEELKQIDAFVRANTIDRFGPVRSVAARPDFGLVLEVAFEGLNRSKRHKSGVAMRFPRISRLRWDKSPDQADTLSSLETLLS